MESKYHFRFENLHVYGKAMDFGEYAVGISRKFPKEERFELTSQFRRAGDSIALNISEGYSGTDKQFYNRLGIAWHSAEECVTCASKAYRRGYITFEENEEIRKQKTEISKMITSLRNTIRNRFKTHS